MLMLSQSDSSLHGGKPGQPLDDLRSNRHHSAAVGARPLQRHLKSCGQFDSPKLVDVCTSQWEAAEKHRQKKIAEEARLYLRRIQMSWVTEGLGIHLFLSGTLKWKKERNVRRDFFGSEWRVADGWAFGYGSGLQALEVSAESEGDFPATVQFEWGKKVNTPERTSLSHGGVTTAIALFLASFFAKHEGRILISGHSQGAVYALLLFRVLQEAAQGKFRAGRHVACVAETAFAMKLIELAQGPDAQDSLQEWAQNARVLVTGPLAVAFNLEWAEYYLVKHQCQIAAVISSVAMTVRASRQHFEYMSDEQITLTESLGRIPDFMYGFSHGKGRCLADAQVKAIFEEFAFLLEARLCDTKFAGGFDKNIKANDQGQLLHRGLGFLQEVGPSCKLAFDATCLPTGKHAGACWEIHRLGNYRSIAKVLLRS